MERTSTVTAATTKNINTVLFPSSKSLGDSLTRLAPNVYETTANRKALSDVITAGFLPVQALHKP